MERAASASRGSREKNRSHSMEGRVIGPGDGEPEDPQKQQYHDRRTGEGAGEDPVQTLFPFSVMFLCIGDRLGRQVFGGEGGGSLRYGEPREQEAQAQGHEAAREASSFFKVNRPLADPAAAGSHRGSPRERSGP